MRILIFGTGKVARDLLENKRIDVNYIEAFTETVSTKSQWYGKRVIAFEEIQNIDAYDMLIIALMRPDDIYKRCLEKKLNLIVLLFVESLGSLDLKMLQDMQYDLIRL